MLAPYALEHHICPQDRGTMLSAAIQVMLKYTQLNQPTLYEIAAPIFGHFSAREIEKVKAWVQEPQLLEILNSICEKNTYPQKCSLQMIALVLSKFKAVNDKKEQFTILH